MNGPIPVIYLLIASYTKISHKGVHGNDDDLDKTLSSTIYDN